MAGWLAQMAVSPAHKLGQIIGDQLEAALRAPLEGIANECGLFLDWKHERAARGGRRKVTWTDSRGNKHDLDYVLEEDGSEDAVGRPRAFIESAWRRYTKHSRNKAQEIQGAIVPLAETYHEDHPFLGVVLGGTFTEGSLKQFESHGFSVVYCRYESIVSAFAAVGVDVSTDEGTSGADLQAKVDAYEALTDTQRDEIANQIRELHKAEFEEFFAQLRSCLARTIELIWVLPLAGSQVEAASAEAAIEFVLEFDEGRSLPSFQRYEIDVRYTNGDEMRASFRDKAEAVKFLRGL